MVRVRHAPEHDHQAGVRCEIWRHGAGDIGTINSKEFLVDEENRRFWVTNITAINWKYRELDVNQLWAQAMHDYK
jgi:predicted P-loop ATPase